MYWYKRKRGSVVGKQSWRQRYIAARLCFELGSIDQRLLLTYIPEVACRVDNEKTERFEFTGGQVNQSAQQPRLCGLRAALYRLPKKSYSLITINVYFNGQI